MTPAAAIDAELRRRLAPLAPLRFELVDESHRHAGHAGAGAGGHYRLTLVSATFAEQGTVLRHRRVFGLVGDLMQNGIHALSIKTLAPDEV